MADEKTTGCACVGIDAYDCFARRYNINSWAGTDLDLLGQEPTQRELVDAHGGPCQCCCHHEDECRDDDF